MFTDSIYVDKLLASRNNGQIKIINGVKKCGKSVLIGDYIKKLTLEDVTYDRIFERNLTEMFGKTIPLNAELEQEIRKYFSKFEGSDTRIYLLLDNIINLDNWVDFVVKVSTIPNMEMLVTASHGIKMNDELKEKLAERYEVLEMFPLSFKEYVIQNNLPYDRVIREDLINYIHFGGFPNVIQSEKKSVKLDTLEMYWDSTVIMDLAIRYNIRNIIDENKAIVYMSSTLGNPLSISNILSYMKDGGSQITYPTITTYIKGLIDSNILYPIQRYDTVNNVLVNAGTRYYVVDTGLSCVKVGSGKFNDELLLKNVLYLEFRRRGYNVNIAKVGSNEITFLVEKDGESAYYEVCKTLIDPKFRNKRMRTLKLIKDNYPKHILSLDEENYSEFDIKHHNILDFLLNRK